MEIEIDKDILFFEPKEDFVLESGKQLKNLKIAYHTFGALNAEKSNVVWVFHALTANSNVLDWWSGLVGVGKTFDPERHFIVCVNTLGSPYGSSQPTDLNFPQFTVRDVVNTQLLLAKHLNINAIDTAIGGSFGGNQALEFAYSFPGKIAHLVLVCSSARESAWGIAVHEAQRIALQSDPTFGEKGGGESGMKAARSVAMLTYRTAETFEKTQQDVDERLDNFKASSYLQYQGQKFADRFDALPYFYLSKCLDSHNIGRGRAGEIHALQQIKAKTLVVGIKSDVLVPVRLQQFLAEHIPNATYEELDSPFGHDGFLVEAEKIGEKIQEFIAAESKSSSQITRSVLKFGGKSLANGIPLQQVLDIVTAETEKNPTALVLSARGESTDLLINIYNKAKAGEDFTDLLNAFFEAQENKEVALDFTAEKEELKNLLSAIRLLQTDDAFAYDKVLSFGELLSVKVVCEILKNRGLNPVFVDARQLIYTRIVLDEFEVDIAKSKAATQTYFSNLTANQLPVITGFIASSEAGKTVTLGRNGSNYTATLIASFIAASEVQNWTDVEGVFSASPKIVPNAVRITEMSYREANELANFGVNILHPKTILPLIHAGIPLRIKSSKNPQAKGTLIQKEVTGKGIKAVSAIDDVSLVSLEGSGLLDNVGIDGRIFSALSKKEISVRLISQASSERGIGFVINKEDVARAELLLNKEFEEELRLGDISSIRFNSDIAIIAIVGRHNYSLEKAIRGLRRNRIWMHLISNSISGAHISLVVDRNKLSKAIRVVHNEVFGAQKKVHVFAFGKGTVGGTLLDQITSTKQNIVEERNLEIEVIGVADSQRYVFNPEGIGQDWRTELAASENKSDISTILAQLQSSGIENIVVADNTSSEEVSNNYVNIIENGFDLVASNKKANSASYAFYTQLRKTLKRKGRLFYYETNVGAGLPIIDTIKHLYHSSDKITKIRGVFSGSLSYLFNHFSEENRPFSEILAEAGTKGFTEPDPREDLSGMDVARKLIILAREAGLECEYDEVQIQNLVPDALQKLESIDDFWNEKAALDAHFTEVKNALPEGTVLRYIGELDMAKKMLKVSLVQAEKSSPLGGIKNADSIFEIFTEGYGEQPIVVQGAGAGATVTARGVYSDILKIGMQV